MSQCAILETPLGRSSHAGAAQSTGSLFTARVPVEREASPLETLVRLRMQSSGYRSLAAVICRCQGSRVILFGRVRSYHMKQLAQECARCVEGVERVENHLIVSVPAQPQ